ncbi:MAG: hypothetical protein KDC44_10070, partial [Phaeodactylibacter sp.]|nr:hypothetical protein [Phaeodactylibacter sp.]
MKQRSGPIPQQQPAVYQPAAQRVQREEQEGAQLQPPVFQLYPDPTATAPEENELVLDPTSEQEAQIEADKHAAIIRSEGYEGIREEIQVNIDYFVGSARELYIAALQEAYRDYQSKLAPEEEEPTAAPETASGEADIAAPISAETAAAVHSIEQEIAELLKARPKKSYRNEDKTDVRDKLVQGINRIRPKILRLKAADLGTDAKGLEEIRQQLFLKLAQAGPYYAQGTNANILPHPKEGNAASSRTCNLTALAMNLQGLGKSTSDYNGNLKILKVLAGYYTGKFDEKHVTGTGIDKADISSWRLPDFLQILAIFNELRRGNQLPTATQKVDEANAGKTLSKSKRNKAIEQELIRLLKDSADIEPLVDTLTTQEKETPEDFQATMLEAQKRAAGKISTDSQIFIELARYFGVTAENKYYQTRILSNFGDYHRNFANKSDDQAEAKVREGYAGQAEADAKTKLDATGKTYSKKKLTSTKRELLNAMMQTEEAKEKIQAAFDEIQKGKYDWQLEEYKKTYLNLMLQKDAVHREWLADLKGDDPSFSMPKSSKSVKTALLKALSEKA